MSYAKVAYDEIYPGVDLVYYCTQGRVEHDFIVAPGTDPSVIAFDVHGADHVAIDAQGDLVVATRVGDVLLRKPVLYQEMERQRQAIAGGYVLTAEHRVGFQVGGYDATRPLVIDPVLVYTTYLGGSGLERGRGLAVDAAGQVYVTGTTDSPNFPVAGSPFQPARDGANDPFVAKLNATGSALVYATYLGGSGSEYGFGLVVDAAGQVYVTGQTDSRNFPMAGSPLQAHYGGGTQDAFVAKLRTDTLPPEIFLTVTPETLWPPTGRIVTVMVSGTITDDHSDVDDIMATYAVRDEYNPTATLDCVAQIFPCKIAVLQLQAMRASDL